MGCGKSSVGRRLSELLCCPFMDLDAVIEQQTGRSIPEIFATSGEAAFRQMELAALRSIISAEGMVEREKKPCYPTLILSLGGGTVMTPECAALVHEQTMCIYLRTSVDTLVARLAKEASGRPLLQGDDLHTRIETLMKQRSHIYESTAHHIIDTDSFSIDEVAQSILHTLHYSII